MDLLSMEWCERNRGGPSCAEANLCEMGSRLLPLALALGALCADLVGLHRLASYAVLLAVVAAAAAAFVGVGRVLEGTGSLLYAVTSVTALVLLTGGSVVRAGAPLGGRVPTLALSSIVLAALVYAAPLLSWVFEPLVTRPKPAHGMRSAVVAQQRPSP
jgi:hypothetical protein